MGVTLDKAQRYRIKMTDERPPTATEIETIRHKVAAKYQDSGQDYNLEDYKRLMNQDEYVSRFFRHVAELSGDQIEHALAMIYRAFKFRKDNNPRVIKSADIDQGLKNKGSLFLRNRDADGKQLLVFDVKKHVKGAANMDDIQRMFLYFLERVDREDEDGMVTIVFDCAGCGLKNMDMEYIKYMIDVLKDYYPYNLNYILVIDMPWVLNAAWKIIKAWLPAGAAKKIKFVNKSTVDQYVRPDQKLAAWGGTDNWEYEFVEEPIKEEPIMTNGHNHSSSTPSTSSEDEPVQHAPVENMASYASVSSVSDQRVSQMSSSVSFSVEKNSPLNANYDVTPKDDLAFVKGPKGLSATVTIVNKTQFPLAFKVKTTTPERYRVRPSLNLMAGLASSKIEIFYQPITPDLDDYSDVLKDKFLINLFENTTEATYKLDSKEKKPSYQHRLKAYVKRSLLKSGPEKRETPIAVDKDKDVYLKELKSLDTKNQLLHEEVKTALFYTRLTFLLTVMLAFLVLLQFFFYAGSQSNVCATLPTLNDAHVESTIELSEQNSEL